jgi:hypothetical protein
MRPFQRLITPKGHIKNLCLGSQGRHDRFYNVSNPSSIAKVLLVMDPFFDLLCSKVVCFGILSAKKQNKETYAKEMSLARAPPNLKQSQTHWMLFQCPWRVII